MKFSELKTKMASLGIESLADIARKLNTTPQAVSNWKARNQVPHHVAIKFNDNLKSFDSGASTQYQPKIISPPQGILFEEDSFSVSGILLTVAEQLKIILLIPFIVVFITFTYVQFIVEPLYQSNATFIVPGKKDSNINGISGLASQFGVNLPQESDVDLSSPMLFSEIIQSRTFAEKILVKEFYTNRFSKKMSLLKILSDGEEINENNKEKFISAAVQDLNKEYLNFSEDPKNYISKLNVTAYEPKFAKELTDVVLFELESLNRAFNSEAVREKTTFINNRISSVLKDLEFTEQKLKKFNENNRQISSPALQLEVDRFTRDVEVQEGIYLTLKQQLELAKIEEVQKISIVQVLDGPQIALYPFNKNLKVRLLLSGILGLGLGFLIGFARSYFNNSDIEERKKLRRIKHFFKKKGKDIIYDQRFTGTVSFLLILGLPFYLGGKSQNPVFFNMYSLKLLILNIFYIIILIISASLYFFILRKKYKN